MMEIRICLELTELKLHIEKAENIYLKTVLEEPALASQ